MNNLEDAEDVARRTKTTWIKIILLILMIEKILQHIVVTTAFYFNWTEIRSEVVVAPNILMILGSIVALLFVISLWAMITQREWAINLVIALALFDIVGEFIAQGTLLIDIPVSFLVATVLLILALLSHQRALKVA